MDITKLVVSLREKALLYGDYGTYRSQLAGKLLNSRKKLAIATKNRGKFHPRTHVAPEQIAENHEYLRLQLLTAERAWAHAMSMKASHSADTKGTSSKTRSHIVSRLDKAARTAEDLAGALAQGSLSGATPIDILEARAYAALLRGAAQFESQAWASCLKSYSIARVIYSALSTSVKGDVFKDLLSETIDPSIRYAAYQATIPRTEPIPTIAHNAFAHADPELIDRVRTLNPDVLEHGGLDATGTSLGAEGAPTSLTWRGREVKIEDAAIAVAWASVGTAKSRLTERLSSARPLQPKDMAAAYDDILIASQDAVDATKQAIDELKSEGVTQSDPRMQSLQITRTAVNFEMISWRIGRNRALIGQHDGAQLDFGEASKATTQAKDHHHVTDAHRNEAPGRQIAKLKEKVVLYDGTLQSLESIIELPGVANDQELSGRLEATSEYFTALKCLALSRSHSIAGNAVSALALVRHALDKCREALPVLSSGGGDKKSSPRNISITKDDVRFLHNLLSGELQRSRALVEIQSLTKLSPKGPTAGQAADSSRPLISQLSNYPSGAVDLKNIVVYPPHVESVPVKPLFLDVAWNYIDYPDKQAQHQQQQQQSGSRDRTTAQDKSAADSDVKPQKRGWFGFGR
ncbi:hypothetical protein B0T24DRAFT_717450 [Lasiosphaeria ovina]|uniref:Signal recognition particle subunit SRP68 n=1 Tax=Lasiosphaeria ovina TaxID=92902 RepID=A0AAE0NEF9_9PEZI|nr:hypothetical protein B0T24DRAFT_717450 [Lasiosphaeria ovina]